MSGIGCWIFQSQLLTMLLVTKLYDNGEEFGCKIVTVSSERKFELAKFSVRLALSIGR